MSQDDADVTPPNASDDKTMSILNSKGKRKRFSTARTTKIKTDLLWVSRQGRRFIVIVKESYKMSATQSLFSLRGFLLKKSLAHSS